MSISKGRRRSRLLLGAAAAATAMSVTGLATAAAQGALPNPWATTHVGTQADGSVMLPNNQKVSPFGQRTEFTADTVGTAISPDGTKIAVQTGGEVTGAASLNIVDAATGNVLQSFGGSNDSPPVYSPDGTALYVGATTASGGSASGTNTIMKYTVDPSTGLVTNPTAPVKLTLPSNKDFPYALAVSADGSTLYAALSASNTLGVIDTATMTLTTKIPVGDAPGAVAIVGDHAFVANRAGDPPAAGSPSDDSAGTQVASDPRTGAATSGSVSVVDLSTNAVTDTIKVGLSPASLTVNDGSVFVANSGSDTVSVIDATSHKITQTFNVNPLPGTRLGASPNAVTLAGKNTLLVSVAGANAIAEYAYSGPRTPVRYLGLMPTDWYPDAVSYDAKVGKVIVGNEYGIGTNGKDTTHQMTGTVTSFAPPSNQALGTLTSQVFANDGWNHLPASNQAAPKTVAASGSLPAIPTQLGAPSAIKHVFLIIKENRTYDQVLGDLGKGNGDSAYATYGASVTPNQHSIADTFVDLDNMYDPAQQSADGHMWADQGNATDYLARDQAAYFARSYGAFGDPLDIQRGGYIWNDAEAAGRSVKIYGEAADTGRGTAGTWQQYYADSQIMEGKATGTLPVAENAYQWNSSIPSVNAALDHNFPTFDTAIPDQYRVDVWNQDFQQQLAANKVPNLSVLWVMDDHTGGTPTARAQVADNDLATGRIIDDISHSKVWKDSAVFVEEDDTQAGDDHVDGHRGPFIVASPYAKHGAVDSSYYTQVNVVKTIEQILGAQPMNQMDRAAVPMYDAFTNKPDLTPYDAVPNQIPLTEGVTGLIPVTPAAGDSASTAKSLSATAGPAAPTPPAAESSVAARWASWLETDARPKLTGSHAVPDATNPAQLNRYDWYTATNWSKPYPGDKSILAPDQVPGRNVPTDLTGDN